MHHVQYRAGSTQTIEFAPYLESLAPQAVFAGYRARIYHGEEITFAVLEVEPNAQSENGERLG